jgi:hydrogenase expression/formation protein HypD
MKLRPEYRNRDAALRFQVEVPPPIEPPGCRCGEVLRGIIAPAECGLFGRACTPDNPKGACMVSSEGSCAAHYNYGPYEKIASQRP